MKTNKDLKKNESIYLKNKLNEHHHYLTLFSILVRELYENKIITPSQKNEIITFILTKFNN